MTSLADPYRHAALEQVWHLVALVDRNPDGVYALVRLRDIEDPRNPLDRAPAAVEWVRWGFEYRASLQHANGAYHEACPNEQRPSPVAQVKCQARAGDFLAATKVLALAILELWPRMFVDGESLAAPAGA